MSGLYRPGVDYYNNIVELSNMTLLAFTINYAMLLTALRFAVTPTTHRSPGGLVIFVK